MSTKNQNCESDCKVIHDSWGRLNQLAQALANKNQIERRQIRETYKKIYGEDLINRLQKTQISTAPNVCSAMALWMLDPFEREAMVAREALDHRQTEANYRAIVEIFVGRKSSHIYLIKQAYQAQFRRQLDQDIVCIEPPHPYQRILMALAASHKAHHRDVSQHIAKCDARRLYETGEGRSGAIDEAVVLEILSKRTIPQLNLTFCCYKHIYGHRYTKSLKNENYGEFEDTMKTVAECIHNPPKYYAKTLYASLKSRKTHKDDVVRVMLSRAEVDIGEIQSMFKNKYGMKLKDAICESIPSGDYRDFLIALATKSN